MKRSKEENEKDRKFKSEVAPSSLTRTKSITCYFFYHVLNFCNLIFLINLKLLWMLGEDETHP